MRLGHLLVLAAFALFIPVASRSGSIMDADPTAASSATSPAGTLIDTGIFDSDPQWDWRAHYYDINPGPGLYTIPVESPFWEAVEGLEDMDFDPEDGWVLMASHLGTAEVPVRTPWFILYNKYRGTLRFIAYVTHALHGDYDHGQVTMRFANGSAKTKNLTNRSILRPLAKWTADEPAEQTALIRLQDGWNYANFTITYDPNVHDVVEPSFVFEINAITDYVLKLDGTLITQTKSATVTNLSSPGEDVLKNILPGYHQAQSWQKQTAELIASGNKMKEKSQWPSQTSFWDAFINPLLGNATRVNMLAGMVGFAEKLIGGLKKRNNEPAVTRTEGTLLLTGSMTGKGGIASVQLRVPGANHNGQPNMLPIWDYPLGVFAIQNAPNAVYALSPNSACVPDFWSSGNIVCNFQCIDVLNMTSPVQWVVNDRFPGWLPLRSIEGAWSFQSPQLIQASRPGVWGSIPDFYLNTMNAKVADGRYVVINSGDPHGIKYFAYRTQFVPLGQLHTYKPEIPRLWYSGMDYGVGEPGVTLADVTPPVQVRARFIRPGGNANDDIVIVDNYHLYYPDQSPATLQYGPFPTVAPVWKYPEAPHQELTNPVAQAVIQANQPWHIQWTPLAGDITSIQAGWSCAASTSFDPVCGLFRGFDLVYNGIENRGDVAVNTAGNGANYWVTLTTCNGPACYTSERPINFTYIDLPTVAISAEPPRCDGGNPVPVQRLVASWSTVLDTGDPDMIDVWMPSGQHYSASKTLAAPSRNHNISIEFPCEAGGLRCVVSSGLTGYTSTGRSLSRDVVVNVTGCGDCGGSEGGGLDEGGEPGEELRRPVRPARNPVLVGDPMDFELYLAKPSIVEASLYDVAGHRVAHLPAQAFESGRQHLRWTPPVKRPGVYFLRLNANGKTITSQRMIVIQ